MFQRFQALYLIQARHLSAPAVAAALQVSATAVHQWVYLYNHAGVEGIMPKGRGGRRRAYLTLAEEAALLEQSRARAGEGLLITAKAVREQAQMRLGHPVSEDYAYDVLHRHGWRKVAPRPTHPESDEEEQEALKKAPRTGPGRGVVLRPGRQAPHEGIFRGRRDLWANERSGALLGTAWGAPSRGGTEDSGIPLRLFSSLSA